MEKKKLLMVAISVGVFLTLTIGAALLVFAPKNVEPSAVVASGHPSGSGITVTTPPPSYQPPIAGDTPAQTGGSQSAPVDALDLVRNPTDVPGLKTPPEGTINRGEDFRVSGTAQGGQNPETLISVPKPSTAAVPDTAPAGKAVSPSTPRSPAVSTNQQKPAASAPAASAGQKPAAQTRVYDDFWVQTGAFSTVAKAEGVKETLASKGITSIVENRVIDGKTFFRVRVGPYTSKNEANYWLSLIRSINGFEDSQVRQTQSRR